MPISCRVLIEVQHRGRALALVCAAAEAGVTVMAATPHMLPEGPWANQRTACLPLVDELRRPWSGQVSVWKCPGW